MAADAAGWRCHRRRTRCRSRIRPARNTGYKACRWSSAFPAAPHHQRRRCRLATSSVPKRVAGCERPPGAGHAGIGRDHRQRHRGSFARTAAAEASAPRRRDRGSVAALRWRDRKRSTARCDGGAVAGKDRSPTICRLRDDRAGCADQPAGLDVGRSSVRQHQSGGSGEPGAHPRLGHRHQSCRFRVGNEAGPGISAARIDRNVTFGDISPGRTRASQSAISDCRRWERCARRGG